MSKVAIICDTHIGIRGDNPVFHKYHARSFDWFFREIDSRKIKHIIHGGDLYDKRKSLNILSGNLCRQSFLEPVYNRGIETHIIAGNHDIFFKNTHEINTLKEVVGDRYLPHIKIYSMPETINIDGLDIQLMPWICDSNMKESVDAIETSKAKVLIGHLEIQGFPMLKGVMAEHGFDKKIFDRYTLVCSGHFHTRSSISNVHYLGAFATYTWADYSEYRGFCILDTETLEIEYLENPEQIYNVIHYDDSKPDVLKALEECDFKKYTETYVKVIVESRNDLYTFDKLIDNLYKANPVDISIVENFDNDDNDNTSLDTDSPNDVEDTPSLLSKYIDGSKISYDKDDMKVFMREIYKEAISLEYVE